MTNQPHNTQELDGIMDKIYDLAYDHLTERGIAIGTVRIKQSILDWHNKQIEEVLDRLSNQQETLHWWTGGEYEKTKAVDMRAIEAERNKLNERANDQL